MRKPITYVQSHDSPKFTRYGIPSSLPPIEAWPTPDKVPVPLRHTLITAYQSGFTTEELSMVYELPVSWVALFVMDAAGCA